MDRLMSKKEVCDLFNISTRTFDRWRAFWKASGLDVGEVKYRRAVRFRQEHIRKLLDQPQKYRI
jgi:hypothetical protein